MPDLWKSKPFRLFASSFARAKAVSPKVKMGEGAHEYLDLMQMPAEAAADIKVTRLPHARPRK